MSTDPTGLGDGQPSVGGPAAAEDSGGHWCAVCGREPAARLRFAQRTGLVIAWRTSVVQELLCRDCARSIGRRMQNHTLMLGWWGFVPFLLNFFTVAGNARSLHKAETLPTPFGPSTAGLEPGRPVFLRVGAGVVVALVALVVGVVVLDDSAPIEVGGCVRVDGEQVHGVECGAAHDGVIVSQEDDGISCDPRTEWWVEQSDRRGRLQYFCVDNDQHPEAWDDEVADLVDGVERAFGASFEHPVAIETLDDRAFEDGLGEAGEAGEVAGGIAQDDAEVRRWRALGLASGDLEVDLADLEDDLTSAWFSQPDETIFVRGSLDDAERQHALAHEMTHALQHQVVGLSNRPLDVPGGAAFQMLVEGDAQRVARAVVPIDDGALETEGAAPPPDVPLALILESAAPYLFGEAATTLRAQLRGGTAAWYDAPPMETRELMLLEAMVGEVAPGSFGSDNVLADDDELQTVELDALGFWSLLAGQTDDDLALAALAAFRRGRWTTVTSADEDLCVIVDLVGPPDGSFATAVQRWAETLPALEGVENSDPERGVWSVRACDPGPDGPPMDPTTRFEAFLLPAVEMQAVASVVPRGVELSEEAARCLSQAVRQTLSGPVRRGSEDPTPEESEALQAAAEACTAA